MTLWRAVDDIRTDGLDDTEGLKIMIIFLIIR
jgi:hypothetical protein